MPTGDNLRLGSGECIKRPATLTKSISLLTAWIESRCKQYNDLRLLAPDTTLGPWLPSLNPYVKQNSNAAIRSG